MRPPTKASTIFHLFLCTIFYFFCVSVTTAKAAPPVVDSVSGELADGQSIAITGTSFGNDGPNVIVFDDFESGTPGDPINTGAGSATYGQWGSLEGDTFYDTSAVVSGSQSFTATFADNYRNFVQADLPAGNRNTFISWWQFLPSDDNWPGEGTVDGINWKVIWMMGLDTVTDDMYIPGILATSKVVSGNEDDPDYGNWVSSIPIVKGEWIRQWVWFKGSTTSTSADGDVKYWYLSDSQVVQVLNDIGVNNLKETGSWTKVRANGYGRVTPNCEPSFDDIYIAAGPNAQARVEIGNAPTYAASTKLTILTPTSWSDSTISATVNVGSFDPDETAYLFVVDKNGNVSDGYPVTFLSDPAASNQPPVAVASSDITSGTAPLTVNFDGSASTDSDGTIVSYSWEFGDGNTGTGSTAANVYLTAGNYTATLTVTDNEGAIGTDTVDITVIADTYPVSYNGNGETSGTVPADQLKTHGVDLTLSGNTGTLAKTGAIFVGWNTAADGTGTDYAEGAMYSTDAALTLYAKWTEVAAGTPLIESVSGTITHNETITVSGSDFGVKSTAVPIKFDDFEDQNFTGWIFVGEISNDWEISSASNRSGSNYAARKIGNNGLQRMEIHQAGDIQTFYSSFWFRMPMDYPSENGNNKMFRTGTQPGNNTNLVWGNYFNSQSKTTLEFAATGDNEVEYGATLDLGTWMLVEIEWAIPVGQEDNYARVYINGELDTEIINGWYPEYINAGSYISFGTWVNGTHGIGSGWLFDDIYIDNTLARAMIGNAPTWDGCTHKEIQIPTAWSGTSVDITVNQGSFSDGDTVYLYVVDADGNVSNGKEVVIGGGSELTINTSTLPDAELNTAYNQTLSAFGGESPYSWSLESGTLPVGLSLNSSGVLSGTPTVAGVYDFTVGVTDSATPTPNTDTQLLSINVSSETTYTVTFIEGTNGSRTDGGELVQTVNHGSAATAPIITANTGYTFIGWDVAFDNVISDLTVTAQYTQNSYTLTYTAGPNGSITPTSPQTVLHGDSGAAVTATPDTGYHFVNWTSDGSTDNPRTDTNVAADISVTANFATGITPTETIEFMEGGGDGTVDVDFDDTYIVYNPATNDTYGTYDYNGIRCDSSRATLIGIKEMFTELPKAINGADIIIESASLYITKYQQGSISNTISVYPVTTNWLIDTAGTNENDVSGQNAEVSSFTTWASGDFSSSDYDGSVVSTGSWVDNYNEVADIDVTDVVAKIYDNELNYGMVLFADGLIYGRASEYGTGKPSLKITYHYGAVPPVPGDIDQDGDVDLTDAILGLQIATGSTPETISPDGDVDGDGKIGIEEVIYILQSVQDE